MRPQDLSSDWSSAIAEAMTAASPVFGSVCSTASCTTDDISDVIALYEPEQDEGWDGMAVFKLKDGRFVFIAAGCDNTGWDCIASGRALFADFLEDLVQFGLGDEDRGLLGVSFSHPPRTF